jgi:hypothetical protein
MHRPRRAMTVILERVRRWRDGWNRFWFTPTDPTTLGAVRVCTGLVLLYSYLACTPNLSTFIGPNAWIDAEALAAIRGDDGPAGAWWGWSVYVLASQPWAVRLAYSLFLAGIVAFTLGWRTRTASVIVWAGHLSFVHRAFLTWSGMDSILAMLTFYLTLAPSGAALSLDQRRRRTLPTPSWDANVGVRLIQVHMAVVYLCAGLAKLQGARWWDGTAVWSVMTMQEFAPFDVTWLGRFGDVPCLLISNVGVLLTLAFEIGFIFLIWNPALRPMLLATAVVLHAGIGLLMGMSAFGAAMLAGCLAFVEPAAVKAAIDRLRRMPTAPRAEAASVRQAA